MYVGRYLMYLDHETSLIVLVLLFRISLLSALFFDAVQTTRVNYRMVSQIDWYLNVHITVPYISSLLAWM